MSSYKHWRWKLVDPHSISNEAWEYIMKMIFKGIFKDLHLSEAIFKGIDIDYVKNKARNKP